jgi:hypothetical protein
VVHGSKAGPTTFTFYDDICFSTGDDRAANFYCTHVTEWAVVLVASANAIEATLSFHFWVTL